jgi:hypothetical protein
MDTVSASVHCLSAAGSARVHVGHNIYASGNRCLEALHTTDPSLDKKRIETEQGGLLNDVYQWVLSNREFLRWRHDEQNTLLWIKGDPGKGKTMLLCGIIDELAKESGALSYFFCQHNDRRINNATAVLRGLIYMLVDRQQSLLRHVQKRYEHPGSQLFKDVNAWVAVRDVFLDILRDPGLQAPYLVIDALDECQTGRAQLLDLIVSSSTASRVKWIVSSRNWPDIAEKLEQAGQKVPLSLELNATSVSAAVQRYVREKARRLAERKKYDANMTAQVTSYLSANAMDTFLWVALVCRNLEKVAPWNALETVCTFPAGLDALYVRMMEQICKLDDAKNVDLCMQILSVVSTVYRPVTLEELRSFVDGPWQEYGPWGTDCLGYYVSLCGSFLTISNQTVSFVHKSAKDFLCSPSLNTKSSTIFPGGNGVVHHILFSKSLHLLSRALQRNMYRLPHPGFPVEDVTPPSPDPLAAAKYSCVYWVDHLLDTHASNALVRADDLRDGGTVHSFLRERYLYWLEALSLLREAPKGVAAVGKLCKLLQVCPPQASYLFYCSYTNYA